MKKTKWWMVPLSLMAGMLAACVFGEASMRLYFAWSIGPRIFLYGSDWYRNVALAENLKRKTLTENERQQAKSEWARKDTVEVHQNKLKGYSKFFPNETKTTVDVDTGERIPVTINKDGFRGKAFTKKKAPGVIRVLTLGSSSTFGYYNRDNETYPYQLEQILNQRCRSNNIFEVINFAIPHAGSGNIAAMFIAEGVDLAPDAVTIYEDRNDSAGSRKYEGVIDKLYSVMVNRLILVAYLDYLLVGERVSLTDPSLKLEPHANERSRVFLGNLSAILEASRRNEIYFIVANQQATAQSPLGHNEQDRLHLRGISYDEEAREIRSRLEGGKDITAYEYSMLVHQRVMEDLKQWAKMQDVPFVDIIGTLDQDRHYLLSWVHLHPKANQVIASKLSEPILRRFCSGGR